MPVLDVQIPYDFFANRRGQAGLAGAHELSVSPGGAATLRSDDPTALSSAGQPAVADRVEHRPGRVPIVKRRPDRPCNWARRRARGRPPERRHRARANACRHADECSQNQTPIRSIILAACIVSLTLGDLESSGQNIDGTDRSMELVNGQCFDVAHRSD